LRIDLSTFFVESDQGTGLRSVCARQGNRQLFRLHHMPVSLAPKWWRAKVENLIKCRVHRNLNALCVVSEPFFQTAEGAEKMRLTKLLKKIGVRYIDGRLVILDDGSRCGAFSMIGRVAAQMPEHNKLA
jgi:hypothetical protein